MDGHSLPPCLTSLDVSVNRLHSLSSVTALVSLSSLNVAVNRLTTVDGLTRLPYLTSLQLSHNPIASFPALIPLTGLASLRHLSLGDPLYGQSPVSSLLQYPTFMRYHFPHLLSLDGLRLSPAEVERAASLCRQKAVHYGRQRKVTRRVLVDTLGAVTQLSLQRAHDLDEERRHLWQLRAALLGASASAAGAAEVQWRREELVGALTVTNVEYRRLHRAFARCVDELGRRQGEVERAIDVEMESAGNCRWEETANAFDDAALALQSGGLRAEVTGRRDEQTVEIRRAIRWRDEERRQRWEERRETDDEWTRPSAPSQPPLPPSASWLLRLRDSIDPLEAGGVASAVWSDPSAAQSPLILTNSLAQLLGDEGGHEVTVAIGRLHMPSDTSIEDVEATGGRVTAGTAALTASPVHIRRCTRSGKTWPPVEEAKSAQLSIDEREDGGADGEVEAASPLLVATVTDRHLFFPDLIVRLRVGAGSHLQSQWSTAASLALRTLPLPAALHDLTADCPALREPLLDLLDVLDDVGRRREARTTAGLRSLTVRPDSSASAPLPFLNLAGSSLSTLPPFSTALSHLNLSCAALTALPLPPLPHLLFLDVSYNQLPLHAFPASLFDQLPALEHFHGRGNPILLDALQLSTTVEALHPLLACLHPCSSLLRTVDWGQYEAGEDECDVSIPADLDEPQCFALIQTASPAFQALLTQAVRVFPHLEAFDGLVLRTPASPSALTPASLLPSFTWRATFCSPLSVSASQTSILTPTLLFQRSFIASHPTSSHLPGQPHLGAHPGGRGRVKATDLFPPCTSGPPPPASEWQPHVTEVELDHLSLTSLVPVAAAAGEGRPSLPFSALSALTHLSLDGNRLSCFERVTSQPFAHLVDLSLEANCLSSLALLPLQCPHLTRLDLSHNRLASSSLSALSSLPSLRILHCEHNQLTSLDGLKGCLALTELHAGHNPLADANTCRALAAGLQALTVLDVSASPLHAALAHRSLALYSLPGLHLLDGRRVEEEEREAAFLAYDGRLSADTLLAHVGHGHFALLDHLDLSHRRLKTVDCLTATALPCLRVLVLDHNEMEHVCHLQPLPTLHVLRLNCNRLTKLDTVGEAALWRERRARAIGVGAVEEEGGVGVGTDGCHLAYCYPALQVLELANNAFTSLTCSVLAGLRRLRVLQLEGNGLERIDGSLAAYCPDLRHLSLSRNALRKLDWALLDGCYRLESLSLEDNLLRTLSTLPSLPELRVLLVAGNKFSELMDVEGLGGVAGGQLAVVSLGHCPLAKRPLYRPHVLRLLLGSRGVRVLDCAEVTAEEWEKAEQLDRAQQQPQAPSGALIHFAPEEVPAAGQGGVATLGMGAQWTGKGHGGQWGLHGRGVASLTALPSPHSLLARAPVAVRSMKTAPSPHASPPVHRVSAWWNGPGR